MTFKIISVLLSLAALAFFLMKAFRGAQGPERAPARNRAPTADLVACERCGAYRPVGALCRCRKVPTP